MRILYLIQKWSGDKCTIYSTTINPVITILFVFMEGPIKF